MRRGFIGCVALLLALGVTIQPAEARDRKSAAARNREDLSDTRAVREARAFSVRREVFMTSAITVGLSSSESDGPGGKRRRSFAAGLADPEPARTNRLELKLGAMTVRPSIDGIKGAQFSIGF
jgi:hypothetical protein